MENDEFQEHLLRQVQSIDDAIRDHQKQIDQLARKREAYAFIYNDLRSRETQPLEAQSLTPVHVLEFPHLEGLKQMDRLRNDGDAASIHYEAVHGARTRDLRRFILQAPEKTRSREEVVAAAKTMNASVNFPYRFLKRMLETGELLEVEQGKYVATDKMISRVGGALHQSVMRIHTDGE